jgi:hypothetical protein
LYSSLQNGPRPALGLTIILNFSLSALLGGNWIPVLLEKRPMHKSPSQIARSQRAFRNAHRLGLLHGVRILPGPHPCEAVVGQFGREYPGNTVPRLPLPQCTRDRCECKYVAIGSEKFRRLRTTKPTAENLRRLLEALEALGLERRRKDIT